MLYDFLHAFGAGFAFIMGIATGIVIAGFVSRQLRRDYDEKITELNNRVEGRLASSADSMQTIAAVMTKLMVEYEKNNKS